jgi:hypothetical protein
MSGSSSAPLTVAKRVGALLDSLGITYSIGGSLAGSFAGEPRATLDIDIVIDLDSTRVGDLVRALEPDFYIDEHALRRAVEECATTNAIHQSTSVKVDFFVAGGTPLDATLLQRRIAVTPFEGDPQRLWVHSPEDILLQKLRWFKRGGGVSDRQWRDILAIVRAQAGRLDRDYVHAGAVRLDVADLLERAFSNIAD